MSAPATPETRQELAEVIGEAVHTALRKACDSDAASRAHAAIRDLPDHEWRAVTDWAADAALALRKALAAEDPWERLVRAAYGQIALDEHLTLAGIDADGLPVWVPSHHRERAEGRARPYALALGIEVRS